MGLNARNALYLLPYNQRRLYPLVDNKLATKRLAQEAGMNVPELYGVIDINHQIRKLPQIVSRYSSFVVKPAMGSGGAGILVIADTLKEFYRSIHGPLISRSELQHHLVNILSGMYSLGGHPDQALIEYRVEPDGVFEKVTFKGVPDVRIIVFKGVPVMAMLRLPTSLSNGKANLHQGAIGVGIALKTGVTTTAVRGNSIVREHPDTLESVVGIQVPHWDKLLRLASRCYELSGLGYQGVDVVIDREKGPLILEINARPGLNIQIANQAGLNKRLELVEKIALELPCAEARIQFARERFA